jgi:uncharacterized protein (DUF2147 family)
MKSVVLSLVLMFASIAFAQPVESLKPSALFGEWWTPGFNARVRIEPCGDAVCGRIVWMWDETPKDIVDQRPLIGRTIIEGMRAQGENRWTGGRLYNPEDGNDYKGQLQLQSTTRLRVEGCVLFICRQQIWRRVDLGRVPPVAREGS